MPSQLLVNALITGGQYALIAVSFGLIYRTARFFHFAHGVVYTATAYCLFALVSFAGFAVWSGIAVAIAGAVALGAGMEFFVYRPLRRAGSSGNILLLASLGILIALQNTISAIFGDATRALRNERVVEGMKLLGVHVTPVQLLMICLSTLLTLGLWSWLRWSQAGRCMRAVANDRELSRVVGVESERVIVLAFAVGSALVAVAAILSAYDTDVTPMMGFRAILMGVVAVVVGGVGTPGAFLGGFLVGFAQQVGAWTLPTQWQDAVVFTMLLTFLLLRPHGITGTRAQGITA